jgi:hypothetical protein
MNYKFQKWFKINLEMFCKITKEKQKRNSKEKGKMVKMPQGTIRPEAKTGPRPKFSAHPNRYPPFPSLTLTVGPTSQSSVSSIRNPHRWLPKTAVTPSLILNQCLPISSPRSAYKKPLLSSSIPTLSQTSSATRLHRPKLANPPLPPARSDVPCKDSPSLALLSALEGSSCDCAPP